MINKQVMKLLREKTGVSLQRIYQMIDNKKKALQYSITTETAAYLVAADNGIDISRVIKEDELASVREVVKTPQVISKPKIKVPKDGSREILVEIGKDIKVTDPLLPKRILEDAKRMAEVYSVLYIFENSVRNLISKILGNTGTEWWQSKVGAQTKKKVKDRTDKEQRNRFHGKRGAHPIFYTDIDDLSTIIAANWTEFQDIFPNQEWVRSKIVEIEMSRNVIAHNNPLEEHDIARLKVNFGDWIRQISQWTEKQLTEDKA